MVLISLNIKKYLTLITFYLISFNVYADSWYPLYSDAVTACQAAAGYACTTSTGSDTSVCSSGGGYKFDYYWIQYNVTRVKFKACNNGDSCVFPEVLTASGCSAPVSPCDSAEPKLIKTTDILNLFPSHVDSEGCWWSPDHSTMVVVVTDDCNRDGCITEGYYNYNSSSSEPADGDPNFTPPGESFVDELPPPVVNANSNVDDTVSEVQTTQVLEDGTAISTSISVERSSNVDTTVTDSLDDVTVTTVKSPEVIKTTTETTVSNVDNSSTVTNVTNTTVNSSSTSSTTYNKDGSEPNSTSTDSTELSSSTTTTTASYDGDGNYTGGNSSTTDPEPEDPNEPNYKAPKKTKNFNAATKSENEAITKAKENLLNKITDIQTEIGDMFDLTVTGSSASLPCPPPVSVSGFGTFNLCLDGFEGELINIKYILLFMATFLALAIVLR